MTFFEKRKSEEMTFSDNKNIEETTFL